MRLTPQLQIGPDTRAADGCVTLTDRRLVVNRHNAGTVQAFAAAAIETALTNTSLDHGSRDALYRPRLRRDETLTCDTDPPSNAKAELSVPR